VGSNVESISTYISTKNFVLERKTLGLYKAVKMNKDAYFYDTIGRLQYINYDRQTGGSRIRNEKSEYSEYDSFGRPTSSKYSYYSVADIKYGYPLSNVVWQEKIEYNDLARYITITSYRIVTNLYNSDNILINYKSSDRVGQGTFYDIQKACY